MSWSLPKRGTHRHQGMRRQVTLVTAFATLLSSIVLYTPTALACGEPQPPRIWRVFVPPEPDKPAMWWVGVELGLFLGLPTRCSCGLGLSPVSGTFPAGLEVADIQFTLARRGSHPPFVIGPGPLGIPLVEFDEMAREQSLDAVLARNGNLPAGALWTGFQSPAGSPVDLPTLTKRLGELQVLDPATTLLLPPWTLKVWFKFNLPEPPIGLPRIIAQVVVGGVDSEEHPIKYSQVSREETLIVDPVAGVPLIVEGQLNGEQVGPLLLDMTPEIEGFGDTTPGFSLTFKDVFVPPDIPLDWWIKVIDPIPSYLGPLECFETFPPVGPDCFFTSEVPFPKGPITVNGIKESVVIEWPNGGGVLNAVSHINKDPANQTTLASYKFDAQINGEPSSQLPEQVIEQVEWPAGQTVLQPHGNIWVFKPNGEHVIDILHGLVWLTPPPPLPQPQPDPAPILELAFPVEMVLETKYRNTEAGLEIAKIPRFNPVVENPNSNVCAADILKEGGSSNNVDFGDVARMVNALTDPDPRCRLNDSIIMEP